MKKIKLRRKFSKKVIYQLNLVFQFKNNQIKIKLIRGVWLKQKKQFSLKIIKIIININKLNDYTYLYHKQSHLVYKIFTIFWYNFYFTF